MSGALAPTSLIGQRQALLNGRVGRYDYVSAGHYEWVLDEGGGSVVVTSDPSRDPILLTSPSFDSAAALPDNFTGSLTYEYNETYSYYWVPDLSVEDDEPVDRYIDFQTTGDLIFSEYSDMGWEPGSASASFTVNGQTVNAGMTTSTTPAPTGSVTNDVSLRDFSIHALVHLSGYTGQFTLSYSGALHAGTNSAIMGRILVMAPIGNVQPDDYMFLYTPKAGTDFIANQPNPGGAPGRPYNEVLYGGDWLSDGAPEHEIRFTKTDQDGFVWRDKTGCITPPKRKNPWAFKEFCYPGFNGNSMEDTLEATLWRKGGNDAEFSFPGDRY